MFRHIVSPDQYIYPALACLEMRIRAFDLRTSAVAQQTEYFHWYSIKIRMLKTGGKGTYKISVQKVPNRSSRVDMNTGYVVPNTRERKESRICSKMLSMAASL